MRHTVEYLLKKLAKHNGENGTCWDAASNLERLNDVRELIYEEDDYEGTMEWGCIRIDDCQCIYLPGHLYSVREAWIGSTPLLVRGMAYMSMDTVQRTLCCSCAPDTRRALQVTGVRRPVMVYPEKPFKIEVLFENSDDAEEGIHMKARNKEGRYISLEFPAPEVDFDEEAQSNERIVDIISVVKPATKGMVFVRGIDTDGETHTLAQYFPHQVNPTFAQMRIVNYSNGDCDRSLVVLAKKAFRPLTDMNELVDIESVQALRFGYQALTAQDGNRDKEYQAKIALMRRHLDLVDDNVRDHEAMVELNPNYSQALSPEADCGSRL